MFDPGLSKKPIVLLILEQTIEKLVLNKDLVFRMMRFIVSIMHAMIMINVSPLRFKYTHTKHYTL